MMSSLHFNRQPRSMHLVESSKAKTSVIELNSASMAAHHLRNSLSSTISSSWAATATKTSSSSSRPPSLLTGGRLLLFCLSILLVKSAKCCDSSFATSAFRESAPHHHQLDKYELIRSDDLKHRILKRGASNPDEHKYNKLKEVSFYALNRQFRLVLNEDKNLLSARFKAYSVDSDGAQKQLSVDQSQFYEGRLYGQLKSDVSAHYDEQSGLLTAAIFDEDSKEIFVVEPYWRQSQISQNNLSDEHSTMLVYKASDVKHSWTSRDDHDPNGKFCHYVRVSTNTTATNESHRLLRKTRKAATLFYEKDYWDNEVPSVSSEKTRCSLFLVADYLFYETMGGRKTHQTVNFLIALIGRVNRIFLKTSFGDSEADPEALTDMGFVIQEILVHTSPSRPQSGEQHYNTERDWSVRDLLDVFSRNIKHDSFCLAHLFTHRKFNNSVLGLAYVASPKLSSIGGICSPSYIKNKHTLYLNSGITTTQNSFGKRIVTLEVDLVTAHEFGHNWGAEHDPDIEECSPGSNAGGAFIMNTFSVSGFETNNKLFSPCSRRSIKAVLKAKVSQCFLRPQTTFCGNSLVEDGEECDEGLLSKDDLDSCCDADCQLKPGKVCSDKNSLCCNRCRFVRAGATCRDKNELDCSDEAYCTGLSAECPKSPAVSDGTPCLAQGTCRKGQCVPFCETKGMFSCMCTTRKNACKRCCRASANSTCLPLGVPQTLHDGTPCIGGYCEKGRCIKVSRTDIVYRLWNIAEKIDVNTFVTFLKDNIVFVVIIVSLVVWVIGVYFIERYDKKFKAKVQTRRQLQRQQSNNSGGENRQRQNRSHFGTRDSRIMSIPLQDEDDPQRAGRMSSSVSEDSDSGGFSSRSPHWPMHYRIQGIDPSPSTPPEVELLERPQYNESPAGNDEERQRFSPVFAETRTNGSNKRKTRITQDYRKNVPVTDL